MSDHTFWKKSTKALVLPAYYNIFDGVYLGEDEVGSA